MKKKIFDAFLNFLSKLLHKKIVYVNHRSEKNIITAVKSNYGFWYCGDIFSQADIAYGVLSNGTVEAYDTTVVTTVLSELRPDFIFYDIGSNTGWYTMIPLAVSEKSRVYSFEPLAEHIACQNETIRLNRKEDRVEIFEVALSDHEGNESIRLAGSGTSLQTEFLETDFGTRNVPLQTLDAVVHKNTMPYPDFIKIDVEGYEYKVLKGAEEVLEKSKPVLFVEIAKTMNTRHFIHKEFDAIFEKLSSLQYTPFLADGGVLKKFDPAQTIDGVHMFLFLNKETHLLNTVLTKKLEIQ